VSLEARTVPALSIGRKIGPASIPAASSHPRSARAGQATSPRAMAMVTPSPSCAPDRHQQAGVSFGDVGHVEGD